MATALVDVETRRCPVTVPDNPLLSDLQRKVVGIGLWIGEVADLNPEIAVTSGGISRVVSRTERLGGSLNHLNRLYNRDTGIETYRVNTRLMAKVLYPFTLHVEEMATGKTGAVFSDSILPLNKEMAGSFLIKDPDQQEKRGALKEIDLKDFLTLSTVFSDYLEAIQALHPF